MGHIEKVLELLMVLGVREVLSEAQTTGALMWNWLNVAETQKKQRDIRGRERRLPANKTGTHCAQQSAAYKPVHYRNRLEFNM